jgi:hypothetical protein
MTAMQIVSSRIVLAGLTMFVPLTLRCRVFEGLEVA